MKTTFKFTHKNNSNQVFTATKNDSFYQITWENDSVTYPIWEVEGLLQNGSWLEVEEKETHLTIWQQLENGHWVLVRTRPTETAKRLVKEYNELKMEADRRYDCFPINVNPNKKSA